MDGNYTGRMLLESARRLGVDAVLVRDAAELIDSLDRERNDPDSRRVIGQLREMGHRYGELARRLKYIAGELQDPADRGKDRVARIGEVLAARREERAAAREAQGGGA
ncbi:hypothetical protein OJF2_08690 [Aquisphaera giovannonii]|uniref:Uncharacterized protein n=1 Tax=Aquisphaera giovannonii TaxID=406548 RepID=A0A5B9VWD6_9BACT|nr:hypothetical protein [Aquisphaera giovannonii]QEH32399.1 hypothetical protein OJF2_08690 [Aquisphaera giovannonii]